MILPYDINFYGVFLTKTKVVPLPVFSKYWCFLNWYKKSNILKKCKATTLVLVENTSYQWYYRVKSIVWSILIKITAGIEYSTFYVKKTENCWWTWSPSEQPKYPYYTLSAIQTTKIPYLHRPKNSWLGYNFRGGGAGPFFTQRFRKPSRTPKTEPKDSSAVFWLSFWWWTWFAG